MKVEDEERSAASANRENFERYWNIMQQKLANKKESP
jgi:hypothetical protein